MPSKRSTPEKPVSSVLIVQREVLVKEIMTQLERGNEIAAMPVAARQETDYYGRSTRYIYDKTQEDAFNTARKKWCLYVEELLKRSFSVPNNEYQKGFSDTGQSFFFVPGSDYVQDERDEVLEKIAYLQSLIERLPLIPSSVESTIQQSASIDKSSKKVFIVHGHDSAVRTEVELLVKNLGYEPIVLFKQPSGGKTIIEKFEDETSKVVFAIILYTACDFGRDKEVKEEKPRARQNVVFEHGYLCAKLGRNRVCALVENGVETPGDLAGVVYIQISGAWQYMMAKEMKNARLDVDMNML